MFEVCYEFCFRKTAILFYFQKNDIWVLEKLYIFMIIIVKRIQKGVTKWLHIKKMTSVHQSLAYQLTVWFKVSTSFFRIWWFSSQLQCLLQYLANVNPRDINMAQIIGSVHAYERLNSWSLPSVAAQYWMLWNLEND